LQFRISDLRCRNCPISKLPLLPPEAPDIVDEMPDLLRSDARLAFQTGHCRAQAVADVDENLPIGGPVIPFFVGQIRSLGFSGGCELFGFFSVAKACRAVALQTQSVVKPLTSR